MARTLSDWGPWKLDPETNTLWHSTVPGNYPIHLPRCDTSAETLDFIMQVAGKPWGAEPDTLAGLVHAFNDILAPQGTMCSGGVDTRVEKSAIENRVQRVADRSDVGDRIETEPS